MFANRSQETSFPKCLELEPGEQYVEPKVGYRNFLQMHNEAIKDYVNNIYPVSHTVSLARFDLQMMKKERAVLDYARVICEWHDAHFNDETEAGYYDLNEVVGPMLHVFTRMLDYDCGRLDCGTISGWVNDLAVTYGWDLNLMEVIAS